MENTFLYLDVARVLDRVMHNGPIFKMGCFENSISLVQMFVGILRDRQGQRSVGQNCSSCKFIEALVFLQQKRNLFD